ncbi:MAG TPA: hypothetical protein PK199_08905, partial [Bacteroidales bacterium]|nr:hypothetical protein [Bacteroidales bacterium]
RILSFEERWDSNSKRMYYRELVMKIQDYQGNTKEFIFTKHSTKSWAKVNEPFTSADFSKYIQDLNCKFEKIKTFAEIPF